MSGDRCHQVEEVKDNLGSCFRFDTNGYERCKGIASHVGIYSLHETVADDPRFWPTLLPNSEQFIRLPCHHTASQPTPAPLHDAAQDLSLLVPPTNFLRCTHHWLCQHELLSQLSALKWRSIFIEEIANEGACCARIRSWAKRQEEEGHIEC